MSLPRRKRKGPNIVSNIPFDKRESVNYVTVSKHKQRFKVKSAKISVPVTTLFHTEESTESLPPLPSFYTEEDDAGVYSDVEEAATSTTQKADRKGPSRSVSVSPFLLQYSRLLISTIDNDGGVVKIPLCRIHRYDDVARESGWGLEPSLCYMLCTRREL